MKNLTLLVLILFPVLLLSQTQTENYIRTKTYKVETQNGTTNANTQAVLTSNEKAENITYFDGLGRPIQQIAYKQSGAGKDIVTPIEYDGFGRQEKEYLPYVPTAAASLNYKTTALTDVLTFYDNTKYDADFPGMTTANINPYSQKELEPSPLNRVLKQAAPGNDWKLGNGHEIKLEYRTNLGNEVKNFGVSLTYANNTYTPTITQSAVNSGFYNANELYKTVTYDENTDATPTELNGSRVEFKNKEGQIVLKRAYSTVGSGTVNEKNDTYYVYDIYGNLTYVLPPKATDIINSTNLPSSLVSVAVVPSASSLSLVATNSITLSNGFHAQAGSTFTASIDSSIQNILDNLCYQYKYDNRNRLVEKKLPGKQWEFIVYDKLDRVVATGPAFSPFSDSPAGVVGWMITKYDVFNRPVYTGWEQSTTVTSAGRAAKQNAINGPTTLSESKTTTATTIDNITGIVYYTNTVQPTIFKLLTVNYYDDYNFQGFTPAIVYTSPIAYNNSTQKPKGLATGSWVRVPTTLSSNAGESSYILYDVKARPVRTFSSNYLGGYTQTDSNLNAFSGQLLSTETRHKRVSGDAELYVKDTYTYTPQDRLLTHTHKIGTNGVEQLLAKNEYDELGQLIVKRVGGTDLTGSSPLQKVDYSYNIRGWLTGINNDATKSLILNTAEKDLFGFQIKYNDITDASKKLYNGNISQTSWRTVNTDSSLKSYTYTYDDLNRLRNADDNLGKFTEALRYDKNGNILYLKRLGEIVGGVPSISIPTDFGVMDELTYTYDTGNKLQRVSDNANDTYGFKDDVVSVSPDTSTDYTYDANGNMLTDTNKGITSNITYNHLNLPTKIILPTGTISYIYNANGEKVQKKTYVSASAVTTTTDYLNGYQYEKINTGAADLKFFPTVEGYVQPNAGSYKYFFQYKDHLGNVRLTYQDKQNDGVVGIADIEEENNYYPFGMKQKGYNFVGSSSVALKYRFGGKEYQDELGLNTYDFGFRGYMPDIGRWGVIDSKAEAYYPITPYQYVLNNPLVNADVKGQWTITRHYNLTYNSLSAAGIGKKQADLLAHYTSVYADNPGGHIALNNVFHPSDQNYYRYSTIDYSGTKDSQVTDWNGKGYNHNIWHSMRSGWEKDNDKISAHDATERGMEFGWGKVFESAKSGKLNDLKANSKGIKAFGQGVHALQDAYAHHGTTMEEHSAYNDRYGDTSGAMRITGSAVTVHNILSGNWSAFEGKTEIKFDAQGMSRSQYNTVMNAIYDYLKKDKK